VLSGSLFALCDDPFATAKSRACCVLFKEVSIGFKSVTSKIEEDNVPKILLLAFLLLATSAFQVQKRTCDHPAPPEGMHYVCSPTDSCDCDLERNSSESDERVENSGPAATDSCSAADLKYFVAPPIPRLLALSGNKTP
jgi:hypothetical protein